MTIFSRSLPDFLDGGLGAHREAAAAGFVGLLDALAAGDVAAGGKIGARDELHHFLEREFGLFDHGDGGVDDFAKIVRRNVGGHADGDAAGAVDEKIRQARRQDGGLFFGFVEVRNEIDGFLLDVGEEFFGDFGEARFGVSHGRGHVAVDGAEVTLAVDERVPHVEVLRHAHEGVVHRSVAVRVEFAKNFADDFGAFAVGLGGGEAELVHAEQNAAMHGLEAVADIGKRAPDDDAHGVIEVRLPHFGFDVYRQENGLILFVGHVSSSFLSLRYALQHVGFHRVEGIGRVGETARREIHFHLLQKGFARGFVFESHRYALLVIRSRGRRAAKFAHAQSTQPRQCRPAQLVNHFSG